jgi:hypothetical protein
MLHPDREGDMLKKLGKAVSGVGRVGWAALNSAFVLWLLSATVIAAFTAAYTDAQNYRKDFENLTDRYDAVSNEIWTRYARFVLAWGKRTDWTDENLLDFLNKNAFRREFQEWGYMDVEFEAHRVLDKLRTVADVGERACTRGHECEVQKLLAKYRKEKESTDAPLQKRAEWIGTWHPGEIRESFSLQIRSKCSLRRSFSQILSFE